MAKKQIINFSTGEISFEDYEQVEETMENPVEKIEAKVNNIMKITQKHLCIIIWKFL